MSKKPKPRKAGRPTIYSDEIVEELCMRISLGEYAVDICEDEHMPGRSTIVYWLNGRGISAEQQTKFVAMYARAREVWAEFMVEDILKISDGSSADVLFDDTGKPFPNAMAVQRDRLKVDSRKWIVGKVLAKFADRTILEGGDKPIEVTQISAVEAARRIAMVLAEGKAAKEREDREKDT
jgi:hypothetical protein